VSVAKDFGLMHIKVPTHHQLLCSVMHVGHPHCNMAVDIVTFEHIRDLSASPIQMASSSSFMPEICISGSGLESFLFCKKSFGHGFSESAWKGNCHEICRFAPAMILSIL
jgi:hypothetical protein